MSPGYLAVETVAFLSELAMLATLGVVGWHLGGGALISIALAALFPALAALIWSVWLAPKATGRRGDPARLIVQIVLFVVSGALAVLSGFVAWGIVLAVVGVGAFAADRVVEHPPHA